MEVRKMTKEDKKVKGIKWLDDELFALRSELKRAARQLERLYEIKRNLGIKESDIEADETIQSLRSRRQELIKEFRSKAKVNKEAKLKLKHSAGEIRRIPERRAPGPFRDVEYYHYPLEHWINILAKRLEEQCLEGIAGAVSANYFESHEYLTCTGNWYGVDDSWFFSNGAYLVSAEVEDKECVYGDEMCWILPAPVCDSIATCQIAVKVWSQFTEGGSGSGYHASAFVHSDPDGNLPAVVPVIMHWHLVDFDSSGWHESYGDSFELEFPVNKGAQGRVCMLNTTGLSADDGYLHTYGHWQVGSWVGGPKMSYTIRPA